MKCTADMVAKYKFYTPLAYSKEESSLPPLARGKVLPGTIVEDQLGHGMMKNPASMANLAEAVPAGSKIKLLLSLSSPTAQGIYNNTTNSLTGASASSAGAIHYATISPPSNPMPMARPRAHGSMKVGRKSQYAPGVFKAHLRSVALGRTKRGGGRKKAHKKHHVRRHRHKAGTEKRKGAAYCTRPYR